MVHIANAYYDREDFLEKGREEERKKNIWENYKKDLRYIEKKFEKYGEKAILEDLLDREYTDLQAKNMIEEVRKKRLTSSEESSKMR